MGNVSVPLKRSYACVISVIAIITILLLGFTLFGHGILLHHEKDSNTIAGLHFMYGFCAVNLILAITGGYGVWKEKTWALVVFAVGMILGCLYCIGTEVFALAKLSQMETVLRNQYLSMQPLSNLSHSDLMDLDYAQSEFRCCGLTSFKDWGNSIPKSCECDTDSSDLCMDSSRFNDNFLDPVNTKPSTIYAKPCLSFLLEHDLYYLHVILGILLGFILLWMLSIGLCIAILCQLNKKADTPKVVYSPAAKAGNYSNLNEVLEDA